MDKALLHPELREKDTTYVVLRSNFWSAWFFPAAERISWFGSAIREDGKNGMYCTDSQFENWPNKTVSDIKIGPG